MATLVSDKAPAPTSESAPLILEPLGDKGASTVGIGEVIRLAFDSLRANKIRALLTMLGVIIGVASVVTLLSVGNGASAAITAQFSGLGTNLLFVRPGAPSNNGPGGSATAQTLTLADSQAIGQLGLPIVGPAPVYGQNAQLVAPAADKSATVNGVTPIYQELQSLALASGSFFDDEQTRSATPVIVLGSTVARELFGSGQAVGQMVRVDNQNLRVIGVLVEKGSGGVGQSVDDQALVPITLAQQRLFGGRTPDGNDWLVSTIQLSVPVTDNIPAVQDRISALLRDRHELNADGTEDDFNVINQASFLTTLNTILGLMTGFLVIVASISLIVGGIGIMNIMLVSVTERTREIGLRKAVGARPRDILLQFVVEALTLSTTGGIIGLLLGSLLPIGLTLTGVLDSPISVSTVVISVGFSMAVGLFFGIYPARRASQLNPIQALRYE
ncbi:MAG: ABC transporter permease [Chloroflexaceae bacterium]|nr:ABC transporter permease [Chloroflexaceae bacterium]